MTSFEFKWNKNKNNNKTVGKGLAIKKAKNLKTPNKVANELELPVKLSNSAESPRRNTWKKYDKKNNFQNDYKESFKTSLIKRKNKKDKLKHKSIEEAVTQTTEKLTTKHSLFSEKYKNVHINTDIRGKSIIEKVFSSQKKFNELEIHRHIVSNLEKHNFKVLTTVQEKSIPKVLLGQDCLIRSQTGSGKTIAYAVPILNTLVNISPKIQRTDGIQAIIVVPTRELALQVHDLIGKLNTFQWIVIGLLCGGENRKTEKDKLRRGVHILIATPGRLLDHMLHTSAFNAKNVKCLVLDEADRLLDMGFKKDIVRLVEELDRQKEHSSYDPMALLKGQSSQEAARKSSEAKTKTRQTLLLSATLTKDLAELADFTMKESVYIDALDDSSAVNPHHMVIPNTVKQEFILTFVKHRLVMLSAFLIAKAKQNSKTFVFMATNQMVDYHHELFTKYLLKMPVDKGQTKYGDVLLLDEVELDSDEEEVVLDVEFFKLHGSMSQQERKAVFNGFRKAKKGILLCTDVAARGIDVPEADCIVQYTGPTSDDDYIHRVGRTGRAGKSGSAVIFLTHEEQDFISRLQDHKVFLKEYDTTQILNNLSNFMNEPEKEKAISALQKRYESAISKNKELHRKACFAYSSWSRFYSSFPLKMKSVFDLKKINVGHYVTSFGLQESPTAVAKLVRGQAVKIDKKKLNKKLANHQDNVEIARPRQNKRPIKSLSLTTSEFSSGLEPARKKRKKNSD